VDTASAARVISLIVVAGTIGSASSRDLPIVTPNDNRVPAGVLQNDTLTVDLVVTMARWYPEADDGPYVEAPVFAEAGKPPSIPGPLIRVPEGTTIVARVTNELADSTVLIRGLTLRPSATDSVPIRPGRHATFTFRTGSPGTYFYWATPGTVDWNNHERELLSGALVIDPRGAKVDDRILMINIWGDKIDSTSYDNALAINGKSWPYTERFTANIGDSVHWKVINASIRSHPMHLHGFYFRINSRGTWNADTAIAPEKRELAVTSHMTAATTMDITWSPNRPGNWLFHCHFTFHVNEDARLGHRTEHGDMHSDADPMKHMSGLVVGVRVNDPMRAYRPYTGELPLRKLRLFTDDRPATQTSPLITSYVLQRGKKPPAKDSVEPPAQPILLTKGQPTQVTIINRAHAATSVHWHGIELESYNDGVAGWSGVANTLAPMIAPKDSFVARLILPRAGTFIYHTHLNDIEQITSGAYGPIVVLEPGRKFDPSTDHIVTLGWIGSEKTVIALNGDSLPPPMELKYGVAHRFRIINIGAAGRFGFRLLQDSVPMKWRPRAKDGADLPASSQAERVAIQPVSTGETFDAEWTPPARGTYSIVAMGGGKVFARQRLNVK
jgi:FtsP/CotA-like multicopper oxidase with cupredoxin domain